MDHVDITCFCWGVVCFIYTHISFLSDPTLSSTKTLREVFTLGMKIIVWNMISNMLKTIQQRPLLDTVRYSVSLAMLAQDMCPRPTPCCGSFRVALLCEVFCCNGYLPCVHVYRRWVPTELIASSNLIRSAIIKSACFREATPTELAGLLKVRRACFRDAKLVEPCRNPIDNYQNFREVELCLSENCLPKRSQWYPRYHVLARDATALQNVDLGHGLSGDRRWVPIDLTASSNLIRSVIIKSACFREARPTELAGLLRVKRACFREAKLVEPCRNPVDSYQNFREVEWWQSTNCWSKRTQWYPWYHACKVGEASNPGPMPERIDSRLWFSVHNVTTINKRETSLIQLTKAHGLVFVNEHSLRHKERVAFKNTARQEGLTAELSDLIPGLTKAVGGVGCISIYRVSALQPQTEEMRRQMGSGRLGAYNVCVGESKYVTFFVVYGVTNGHHNRKKALQTNQYIKAISRELAQLPEGPKYIVGDINAEPSDLPDLAELLRQGWIDVGGTPECCARECANVPTCHAECKTGPPTRRDYIFASPEAAPATKECEVVWDPFYPTHARVTCALDIKGVLSHTKHFKQYKPLTEFLINDFRLTEMHGPLGRFGEAHEPPNEELTRGWHWNSYLQDARSNVAAAFEQIEGMFNLALQGQDLDRAWDLWCRTLQWAVLDYTGDEVGDGWSGGVRGKPSYVTKYTGGFPNLVDGNLIEKNVNPLVHRLERQAHRLKALAHMLAAVPNDGISNLQEWEKRMRERVDGTVRAIRANICVLDPNENDLLGFLNSHTFENGKCSHLRVTIIKYADAYLNRIDSARKHADRERKSRKEHSSYGDDPKSIDYKRVKPKAAPPLRYVKVAHEHGVKYCLEPSEVDKGIRDAWDTIRNGNADHPKTLVDKFIGKYAKYMCIGSGMHVAPLTGDDIMVAAAAANNSSAGADGLLPQDLKLMTPNAADMLARLLNSIESLGKWPECFRLAKATCLAKTAEQSAFADPLKQRILVVTHCVYRLWARVRLCHVEDWVKRWATEDMFAGLPGRSAQEAWYSTTIDIELAQVFGNAICGGACDVFKCFDQIQRGLLFELLARSGFPAGVLNAYKDMLDNLWVVNNISGHVGEPHKHPCGIPQGDPWSMLMTAFLFAPWVRMVKNLGAQPRVLADDIFLTCIGENQIKVFITAYEATMQYIMDMGGKVAPDKSSIFASNRFIRKQLRKQRWHSLNGLVIPVSTHARDLGTHINFGQTLVGKTINDRMKQALTVCTKISGLQVTRKRKAHIVRSIVLAKATYGSEAAPPCDALLAKLASRILKCVGFRSKVKCNAIAFDLTQEAGDLDPRLHVMVNRVLMVRRMIARSSGVLDKIRNIVKAYDDLSMAGSDRGCHNVQRLQVCKVKPRGPVGLLLHSLSVNGACLTNQLCIEGADTWPFNILSIPWQDLKPRLVLLGRRARFRAASAKRTDLHCSGMIDHGVLDDALKKICEDDRCVLLSALAQGRWMVKHAARMKEGLDDTCRDCNQAQESPWHLLHNCKTHSHDRHINGRDMTLSLQHVMELPVLMRLGLPPLMGTACFGTLWGSCFEDVIPSTANRIVQHFSSPSERYDLALQTEIQQMAVAMHCEEDGARDLADRLRQLDDENFVCDVKDMLNDIPCSVDQEVPAEPNLYTDGSVLNPSTCMYSVGTAGVVHVRRNLEHCPLNGIEQAYSDSEVEEHALYGTLVKLKICLPGRGISSTRAELAAAILGLVAPRALHLASDSRAMLHKLESILKSKRNLWNARPWDITKDGDLWQLLEHVLRWRESGYSTIASWVKGHAGESHIANGITTNRDASLNDCADKTAESAHGMHAGLVRLCNKFNRRHAFYVNRLVELWKMYACILRKHDAIVTDKKTQEQKRIQLGISSDNVRVSLSCSGGPVGRSCHGPAVTLQGSLPGNANVADDGVKLSVWKFMLAHTWKPTIDVATPGTTWIELLWLYLGGGGKLRCQNDLCVTRVTVAQAVKEFKTIAKHLACIGLTATGRAMFKPSQARDHPLQRLGIHSYLPSICAHIVAPEVATLHTQACIVAFAHRLTGGKRKLLAAQKSLGVVKVVWNPRKTMEWPDRCKLENEWLTKDICKTLGRLQLGAKMLMLRCPHCVSTQDCARNTLWKDSTWKCLLCRKCGKRSTSCQWQCQCGIQWSDCENHREVGFACGTDKEKQKKTVLRISPDVCQELRRDQVFARAHACNKKRRRLTSKPPRGRQSSWGVDVSDIEFDMPGNSGSSSWLARRPLKPGSVAWLVAIRNANSGQRQIDTLAAPAVADRRAPCDPQQPVGLV